MASKSYQVRISKFWEGEFWKGGRMGPAPTPSKPAIPATKATGIKKTLILVK